MLKQHYIVLLLMVLTTAGCSLIDDDLSVCGTDYLINYRMRLLTEVHTVIDEKLSSDIEKQVADTLKKWADPYFSGHAHDLDMSFYSLDGTDELIHHKFDIINASQKSYTLYIPRMNYQHLAVVNTFNNPSITIMGLQHSASLRLTQADKDTLPSHNTAVYTARLPMHIPDTGNISFDVHLYMASAAVALVVTNETLTNLPTLKRVLLCGSATGFNVNDSIFTFDEPSVIEAEKVNDRCFAVVALASKDSTNITSAPARNNTDTEKDNSLWQLKVYTQSKDKSITESVLSVHYPLRAGTMEIIKVTLKEDGSVTPSSGSEIGASVTLDWKPGNEYITITG